MFGAFFSTLIAGTISDSYGRKKVIIFSDLLFIIGSLLMWFSSSIAMLILGRIILGFGIGISSLITPLYVSEMAPKEIRGTLVAINSSCMVLGQFFSGFICLLLCENWRMMLGIAAVPAFI